jgi:hypothetical protein
MQLTSAHGGTTRLVRSQVAGIASLQRASAGVSQCRSRIEKDDFRTKAGPNQDGDGRCRKK